MFQHDIIHSRFFLVFLGDGQESSVVVGSTNDLMGIGVNNKNNNRFNGLRPIFGVVDISAIDSTCYGRNFGGVGSSKEYFGGRRQ